MDNEFEEEKKLSTVDYHTWKRMLGILCRNGRADEKIVQMVYSQAGENGAVVYTKGSVKRGIEMEIVISETKGSVPPMRRWTGHSGLKTPWA